MSMLEHALAYAKRGFPVFPCNRKKEPITQNGVLDATTSTKRIEEWWTRHPNANIGLDLAGAGLMAVDFDPGSDFAEASRALGGLPKTGLVQRTPRGGKHHLYELAEGEAVANSTSKVSPKVDIRGLNGYILLAPSRTEDGEYSWEAQGKPAFRTDEMVEKCNLARSKSKDRDEWIIEPDLPENIKAAERWLKHEAKIAVEGQGGDGMAYATAAHLKSFGISEELAFDLMLEHWNPRCDPPWSGDEIDHLQTKVANAYDYNTSPPGNITKAYKLAKDREKFKPVEKPLPTGREVHAGRFRFVDREGAEHIRPPKWLIPNFIPQGGYCVLFGAPGTFKSFIALDIALSVACGPVDDAVDELWPDVAGKFPVLYCLGEGRPEFSKRIRAWEKHYLDGAKAKNLILSDPVPLVSEELEPFIDGALQMSPEGYGLVVIDTAGRAMQGLNENSQEHASKLTAMVQTLQRDLDCAVLVLHHSGHGEGARAKGSMEFYGAPDTVVGVGREGKERVVTLYMQKQKDAEEWAHPRAIKLLAVGDSLVPTATEEKPAPPAVKGEPAGPSKAVVVGVIDKLLGEILSENRLKPWSTKALAEAIAMADKIEVSSKTLQNSVLRDLREIKGTIASKCYDPKTQRWKWRD
jgi:hypothetical protein